MHSHGQFIIEDNEKNKTIVILSSSLSPSGKLPGRANVMTSLKMLNNIQVQRLSAQLKNECQNYWSWQLYFSSKRKPATLKKLLRDFRICYILLCQDWLRKERDRHKVSLMSGSSLILPLIQHKVVLLVLRTVISPQVSDHSVFFAVNLLARIPYVADRIEIVLRHSSSMCQRCILMLNLTCSLCGESYGHD